VLSKHIGQYSLSIPSDPSLDSEIIAGKINKIPEYYTIVAPKKPDYIIRQRERGQAEAKTSRLRPRPNLWGQGQASRPKFWPRGHFGL